MQSTVWRVTPADAGLALLDGLARKLALSKRKAKALLDGRGVFVNRRRVWMAHHPLRAGDAVEIRGGPEPTPAEIAILFADDALLIADKPPGLLANGPDSVESRLRAQRREPALTAVHRLDKDTSGCLLLARRTDAAERLIALFAQRDMRKLYHAIVSGPIAERERTIALPIEGQSAVTQLRLLDANRQASHVQLLLETGRTHQIRKHLLAIGHPLVGEQAYAGRRPLSALERRAPRQMLHAHSLGFPHPLSGAPVRAESPLPADFRACLHRLGLK